MNLNRLITRAELPNFLNNIRRLDNGNISINGLIIKSNGFIIGVPKVIDVALTFNPTGNVGVGLDTLYSYTLPADYLSNDEDELEVIYLLDFAANNNDKRLQFTFDGTSYLNTGALDIDGTRGAVLKANIFRTSSTSVRIASQITLNDVFGDSASAFTTFGNSGACITRNANLTGLSSLDTNTKVLLAQAEATANDDVTIHAARFRLTQNT